MPKNLQCGGSAMPEWKFARSDILLYNYTQTSQDWNFRDNVQVSSRTAAPRSTHPVLEFIVNKNGIIPFPFSFCPTSQL